jgi:hypothetical protein
VLAWMSPPKYRYGPQIGRLRSSHLHRRLTRTRGTMTENGNTAHPASPTRINRKAAKWAIAAGAPLTLLIVLLPSGGEGRSSLFYMSEIDACAGQSPSQLRTTFSQPSQVTYPADSHRTITGEMLWIWRPVQVMDRASGVVSNQILHADVSPRTERTWSCGLGLN